MDGDQKHYGLITKEMVQSYRQLTEATTPEQLVTLFEQMKIKYPTMTFAELQEKTFEALEHINKIPPMDFKTVCQKITVCENSTCTTPFEIDSLDWSVKQEVQTGVCGSGKLVEYFIPCPACGSLSLRSLHFKIKYN